MLKKDCASYSCDGCNALTKTLCGLNIKCNFYKTNSQNSKETVANIKYLSEIGKGYLLTKYYPKEVIEGALEA